MASSLMVIDSIYNKTQALLLTTLTALSTILYFFLELIVLHWRRLICDFDFFTSCLTSTSLMYRLVQKFTFFDYFLNHLISLVSIAHRVFILLHWTHLTFRNCFPFTKQTAQVNIRYNVFMHSMFRVNSLCVCELFIIWVANAKMHPAIRNWL